MVLTISALICLIGLIIYLASDGKASEVGRIMFGIGLLCVLWNVGGVVNILPYRK
jgi:hypothetical protein